MTLLVEYELAEIGNPRTREVGTSGGASLLGAYAR